MTMTNQMLRVVMALSLASLALSACGDPDTGTECSSQDDCGDEQACVPIAFGCADADSCDSTCEVTCETNDDCADGEICANRNGHEICRSGEIDDPSE